MENDLVSIIVPVYNVSNYLERCLNSIISQTYRNLEIIIVNDGSTDNSLEICKEYANKDKRILVFSKENGGVSSARNYGLSKINGKYLCFIDSDDYVSEYYIEILLKNIKETNSDLSICGLLKVEDNVKKYDFEENLYCVLNKIDAYNEMIMNNQFAGYVWNKLYKVDIIKKMENNQFQEYMIEDFEFNSRLLNYCNKIVITSMQLYYYYVNNNGLTGSFKVNERILKGIDAYNSILKNYDKNNILNSDYVALYFLKFMYNINYRIYMLKYKTSKNIIDKKIYKRVIKSKIISKNEKIVIFFTNLFPIFSYKIKNFLKIKRR